MTSKGDYSFRRMVISLKECDIMIYTIYIIEMFTIYIIETWYENVPMNINYLVMIMANLLWFLVKVRRYNGVIMQFRGQIIITRELMINKTSLSIYINDWWSKREKWTTRVRSRILCCCYVIFYAVLMKRNTNIITHITSSHHS